MKNKKSKQGKKKAQEKQYKHSYPRCYLRGFMEVMEDAAIYIYYCDCDIFFTFDNLLNGTSFYEIYSRANPLYLNRFGRQLVDMVSFEDGVDWESTKRDESLPVDIYQMRWMAWVLTLAQWEYRIDFRDWLKYLSVQDVWEMFNPLHETSLQNAAKKLQECYDYAKENKIFKEKTNAVKKWDR